jgi:hypothetical protein
VSKNQEIQKLIRLYKEETEVKEIDMRAVAAWAIGRGYPEPKPISPIDRLAKDFAAAAREETRTDTETGEPYRVNHVYWVERDGEQWHLWIDIDEAPRGPMHASLTTRREQIVGDITQLTFDAEHWNRKNPAQERIEIVQDFALDVDLRRGVSV